MAINKLGKLGKLKIDRTEDGLSFRFGDGKAHQLRLGFGKKHDGDYDEDFDEDEYTGEEEYEEGNEADYADAGDEGYSSRFSAGDDDTYENDDAYDYDEQDDAQDDDEYYDEADDDQGDDGYYDDQDDLNDGYYDDDEYDDRYQDEDAEDYDDEGYADENPVMRFVDENDWVTYVLLFVLPPLGIYLLWRRRRFEQPIRMAVSAVSGVWFIILLILLFSAIFAGSGDTTTTPPITMTTPTPTPVATSTAEALDLISGDSTSGDDSDTSDEAQTTAEATVDPLSQDVSATATPIAASDSSGSSVSANAVYTTATGLYYHNNRSCSNIEDGAAVSTVTKDVATQSGKTACPICYPDQTTYYATENGTYYHSDPNCSDMKDATVITEEAAKSQGKTACPVCITKEVNTLSSTGLKFATSSTTDKSGVTVYATAKGTYYHMTDSCSGMTGASSGTLLQAMLAGKTACPTCCSTLGKMVYCTEGGKYYHNTSDCSGMENAYKVTLAEALILGKGKCSKCWGSSSTSSSSSGVKVYATKNGKYYHTKSDCSGMTGASSVSLLAAMKAGKTACPTCASGANTVAYATKNGKYYHSYATCSGMTDAIQGTVAQALAYGKTRCPECWSSSSASTTGSTAETGYVYATKNGKYYHTKENCSGMTNASRVTLAAAVKAGKTACPTCAAAANYKVYSTDSGKYYHRTSTCSGMTNAKQRTVQEAMLLGQTACPECIGKYLTSSSSGGVTNVTTKSFSKGSTSSADTINAQVKAKLQSTLVSSGIYKSGTSGIKVYATVTSKYYHIYKNCSGMTGASHITLETALNYGKKACSKCASSANTTVYAAAGNKYYHYSKACAGTGALKGTRAAALALGLNACPYCVTKTKTISAITNISTETYKSGTSGIKVYATVSGKYYHVSKTCAGPGASHITLETALNYGKSACPTCAAPASKTVYSALSDKYYHVSKSCAGSGALTGTYAQAKAMGKTECPRCIGGQENYEESDIKYSAPGDTTVYVNLDSDLYYYHKNAGCSEAGMSSGTGVLLDFVLNLGYRACPYCNPPTSESN